MGTELQEFYSNQIDPEYVYNKLVDLKIDPEDATYGLMVLLKGQVKFGNSVSIFKEKLGFENTDIERAHCSTGNTSSSKPRTIV